MEEVTGRTIIVTDDGFFCVKEINKEGNDKKDKEKSEIKILPVSVSFNHSTFLFNIRKSQESKM